MQQNIKTDHDELSLGKEFFNKSLIEVEPEDIRQFFRQKRTEGQHLEFKSGEVSLDKLLKEICAFLNSEGGLIILGAPREVPELERSTARSSAGEPVFSPLPGIQIIRERIAASIEPAPRGIKLHQVRFDEGSVFLIEVRPSKNPPHQVRGSGKYYLREAAVSRPALHHEVESMFFSKRSPVLDLKIELERPEDAVLVRLLIQNTTTTAAEDPGFILRAQPLRNQEGLWQEQRIAQQNYLTKDQVWIQEAQILPRDPRFFLSCLYYCKNVEMKQKAAFAEIQNNKISLLEVFNSEVHDDFQFWYDQHSYLLHED